MLTEAMAARSDAAIPAPSVAAEARSREAAERAGEPIEGWIVFAFLFPLFFFPWLLMAGNFERQGCLRKAASLRGVAWSALLFSALMIVVARFAR